MRGPLLWLLALSAALKLVYVFFLTDYPQYLDSDFGGYWQRALDRIAGQDKSYDQWAIWPAFPHILLGGYLRAIDALGLSQWQLGATMVLNVALSTGSVVFVYGIARHTLARPRWALAIAAVYAFTFPLVYFNAFVMSEHAAVFCLLGALLLALRFRRDARRLAAAGALLALAVAMRPAFGLFGLPFALYIACADWLNPRALGRAAVFSLAFFALIGVVVAENYRISNGRLLGLSANGGLNFYFAQCRTWWVDSVANGAEYTIVPPPTVDRPEYGKVTFNRPFYDQASFMRLGWKCLSRQTRFWQRNLAEFRNLFFGPLLPSTDSAFGFRFLLAPFQWFFLACALAMPLAAFAYRHRSADRGAMALLAGCMAVSLATMFVFNAEQRYLYPLLGPLYVLAACALHAAVEQWQRVRTAVFAWLAFIGAVWAIAAAADSWDRRNAPRHVSVSVAAYTRQASPSGDAFRIESVRFPLAPVLTHARAGSYGIVPPARFIFDACMNVIRPGSYAMGVVVNGGFQLELNGNVAAREPGPRTFEMPYTLVSDLPEGKQHYRLRYESAEGEVAAIATWRAVTSHEDHHMPAIGLRYIGQSGEGIEFLPMEECAAARAGR